MAKKVVGKIGLQFRPARRPRHRRWAPHSGPYSLNIMDFCKQYNERTASQAGMIIPVEITVFEDRTFTFITKTPPASFLIKRALEHRVRFERTQPQQSRQADASADQRDRARRRCPTSTRTTSNTRRRSSPARPARWAWRWRNEQQHGKRFKNLVAAFDPEALYATNEAVALVKKNANAKFNETVEIHVRLGVDPKK